MRLEGLDAASLAFRGDGRKRTAVWRGPLDFRRFEAGMSGFL